MARLHCGHVGLLLALTACGGAADSTEAPSRDRASSDEASRRGACAGVQVDTWFGPARTAFEARESCVSELTHGCAVLGCAADLETIEVHGYGSGTDTNYYCQGNDADFDSELPKYFGACSAKAPTRAE